MVRDSERKLFHSCRRFSFVHDSSSQVSLSLQKENKKQSIMLWTHLEAPSGASFWKVKGKAPMNQGNIAIKIQCATVGENAKWLSLWKTVWKFLKVLWKFLKVLKIKLPYDWAIPFLSIQNKLNQGFQRDLAFPYSLQHHLH